MEINPRLALASYNRGFAHSKWGDSDEATGNLRRARGLDFQPACQTLLRYQAISVSAASRHSGERIDTIIVGPYRSGSVEHRYHNSAYDSGVALWPMAS
jgi:hypothetical protein